MIVGFCPVIAEGKKKWQQKFLECFFMENMSEKVLESSETKNRSGEKYKILQIIIFKLFSTNIYCTGSEFLFKDCLKT